MQSFYILAIYLHVKYFRFFLLHFKRFFDFYYAEKDLIGIQTAKDTCKSEHFRQWHFSFLAKALIWF